MREDKRNEGSKRDGRRMCKILKKINKKSSEEILEEYKTTDNFAVNMTDLLKNIGIKYYPSDFSDLRFTKYAKQLHNRNGKIIGAVVAEEEDLTIFYSKSADLHEFRFTLAHELAHCCQTMGVDSGCQVHFRMRNFTDKKSAPYEYAANVFAGELLMPKEKIIALIKRFGKISVSEMAKYFIVSKNVMQARLDYLLKT